MPVSQTFREWVLEQLRPTVRNVRHIRMFGCVGLYAGELFFALLDHDQLYLKVDDSNRADFVAAGMGPFDPYGDGRLIIQYYEVPLEVIERPERLAEWAAKAIEVARRAKKARLMRRTKKTTKKPTQRKRS